MHTSMFKQFFNIFSFRQLHLNSSIAFGTHLVTYLLNPSVQFETELGKCQEKRANCIRQFAMCSKDDFYRLGVCLYFVHSKSIWIKVFRFIELRDLMYSTSGVD